MASPKEKENWFDVYRELALLLKAFCDKNQKDPGAALYTLSSKDKLVVNAHTWFKRILFIKTEVRLDPIHVFASISEYGLQPAARKSKIRNWIRVLSGVNRNLDIDFTGCPSSQSTGLLSMRNVTQQKDIWDLFSNVITKGQHALTQQIFDKVSSWHLEISDLTIFLFWIDSENFLSLDKNTYVLLRSSDLIDSRAIDCASYLNLIPIQKTKVYREIVRGAAESRRDKNFVNRFRTQIIPALRGTIRKKHKSDTSDFKLIGIRVLKGTPQSVYKVLVPEKMYCFYKAFDFISPDEIVYDENSDFSLYSTPDMDINISAIVGKNGSGKSTITELLYMAINNIACKLSKVKKDFIPVMGIELELYFKVDVLYRVHIKGSEIKFYEFQRTEKGYSAPKAVPVLSFKFHQYFFTVAINYSHYALNSLKTGNWIEPLFTSNFGYQHSIIISPDRQKGNIDMNNEDSQAMYRLVSNILEPVSVDTEDNVRRITDNGRYTQQIRFTINPHKNEDYHKVLGTVKASEKKKVLDAVYAHFRIRKRPGKKEIQTIANDFIYYKLIQLNRYEAYRSCFAHPNKIKRLKDILQAIEVDTSHITHKIKQAINFLKYDSLYNLKLDSFIDIQQLSEVIQDVIRKTDSIVKQKTIEYIPPSFLDATILLNDGSNFNELSSGEKQRIYAATNLLYHLININSVSHDLMVHYNYVNIIFDEVELYFHPDMQRKFLKYLLRYLKWAGLENIFGLNFCFVTHSPFILSDIPSNNILFLETAEDIELASRNIKLGTLKTFGANIHELLMNGFFMSQTLGDFALDEIREIKDFFDVLEKIENGDEQKFEELKTRYQEKRLRFHFVHDIIGEEYIKSVIGNQIQAIEAKLKDPRFVQKRIDKLNEEINSLKNLIDVKDQLPS